VTSALMALDRNLMFGFVVRMDKADCTSGMRREET
jgi:hypothetical protein